MPTNSVIGSARVRSGLSHPVIDCDGHWTEPIPLWAEYVRKLAGSSAADTFLAMQGTRGNAWYAMSSEERQRRRYWRPAWWGFPANTLDRATAMLPALMYERLDDFGIDFALILATRGNTPDYIRDPELRKVVVRAANLMHAEIFAPFSDRMMPAATVATNTPDEAIEEAEYAVKELGLKVVVINGSLVRTVPAYDTPDVDPTSVPFYVDSLALDSLYDYDPFWAKLVELKVSPMTHSGSRGWVDRSSVTNDVFNHMGHFAQAANSFARALYLGGVTRRFPTLKFAFLEGGVAWGRSLCADLVGHWEKRNTEALLKNLRPSNLDLDMLRELIAKYGGTWAAGRTEELLDNIDILFPGLNAQQLTDRETDLDDFAAACVGSAQEVADEFARNFYFGCESDDPLVSLAFDAKLGPRLKPLFSSDVSHFDVTDMTEVLEEAHELVEHGLLDDGEFREFVFSNTVELHAGPNPDFFRGTVVQRAVEEELARTAAASTPAATGEEEGHKP
ncbi:amidohydrolase family protein [Rhizomonospora bruguierae]|uniref:amidohydrolase family protein n=1 Tax=Rhizomonospora bruguierae TaxID=1581705 RepID=UPI001BCB8AB8|nr:amidohydrolase family protein [Micromonospora sp. NBRC 107566]